MFTSLSIENFPQMARMNQLGKQFKDHRWWFAEKTTAPSFFLLGAVGYKSVNWLTWFPQLPHIPAL